MKTKKYLAFVGSLISVVTSTAWARDVEYQNQEFPVYVTPGEPTQIQFPGVISGGFKKKQSTVSLDRKNTDLIVFAQEAIPDQGEAIIVRLDDGRSYSVRIMKSGGDSVRDDVVKVEDSRSALLLSKEEEEPAYREKNFEYAPPSQVSGLMREMMLNAEFGKGSIAGYKPSDRYQGQEILNDGTVRATIDRIYIGTNLWGYVIDAENVLDQTQKINPATFRLDGTRAISAKDWELSPRPLDVEQQAAAKHKTKIYIITRAK
jgi:hypothetical protein